MKTVMKRIDEVTLEAYLKFLKECLLEKNPYNIGPKEPAPDNVAQYIADCKNMANGKNLARGLVPMTTFVLAIEGDKVIGLGKIRHKLNERLREYGGHIGYYIHSNYRNKGYATHFLVQLLEKAQQIGVQQALLTCDSDNPASSRVIEKNGGELEAELFDEGIGKMIKRYWIDTEQIADK